MLVVIPVCPKDELSCLKNLELCRAWTDEKVYECLITHDELFNPDKVAQAASHVFSKVHLFKYDAWRGPQVWPTLANWAWQSTARYIHNEREKMGQSWVSWFWWEQDAIPLKPDWLQQLEAEYKRGNQPFMGHRVHQMDHINGVAVYPWNVCQYTYKGMLCQAAAWDYVMRDETKGVTHPANHLIGHIWNIAADGSPTNGDGKPPTFKDWPEVERLVDPSLVIMHRCKDGSLTDRLLERISTAA